MASVKTTGFSIKQMLAPATVPDEEAAAQRLAMAQAMQAAAQKGNMPAAGGPVQAKYGIGTALADLGTRLASAYNTRQAQQGLTQAKQNQSAKLSDALAGYTGAQSAYKGAQEADASPYGAGLEPLADVAGAQSQDAKQKLLAAMGPQAMQGYAASMLQNEANAPALEDERNFKKWQIQQAQDQKAMDRQQRMEELQARLASGQETAKSAADLRRELAQLSSATKLQIAGMKGNPAQAKADAASAEKEAAANGIDTTIAQLSQQYDLLEKNGGIASTKESALHNIGAGISSSGVGQAFGRAVGTENQSARNNIAMTRPILLAQLKSATGMSAKQLDSNAELKLWLSAATDPTIDVQANRAALKHLQDFIGSHQQASPASAASATPSKKVVSFKDLP